MKAVVGTLLAIAAVASAGAQAPSTVPSTAPAGSVPWDVEYSDATGPIAPSVDPWYRAPSGYECTQPGQILKIRNATGTLAPLIGNATEAYNILFRTTNGAYQPDWSVATVFLPATADRSKSLSYQIPYDSADVDASPSYTLYTGGGYTGDADIVNALGRGWVVTTTDYEGFGAHFTAGVLSGHATIDSVRAINAWNSPAQIPTDARTVLWGYSGGALASEWALEMAVQYAPEVQIAGAALGGLTPNITSVLYTINAGLYAGLVPAGVVGILTQYPDSTQFLYDNLNPTGPYNATGFLATRNYTLLESISTFVGQDMFKYFKTGEDLLYDPLAQRIVNTDGIMGYHGVPKPPLFVYKAIGDDVSPIHDTDILVDRYCGVGATIDYQRNTVGNHQTESPNGKPAALAFLTSVLAGTYSASGCTITNVTVGN